MTRSILISVLVLGCGGGDDDGMMMQPDGSMNEPLVNGKPASEFYGQFAHAVTMTENSGAAAFPAQADERNAYLVDFFLMPNNKLELFYAEGKGTVTQTGHSLGIFANAKKRRTGTWRIDGANLVLDSFMRCDGFTLNNRDALLCSLQTPIITAAAQGRTATIQKGISPSSPNDTEFADYVP